MHKDSALEIRLLIRQEILLLKELLRHGHGGNQVVGRAEKASDSLLQIIPKRRMQKDPDQIFRAAFFQIPLFIQTVQSIGAHDVGK